MQPRKLWLWSEVTGSASKQDKCFSSLTEYWILTPLLLYVFPSGPDRIIRAARHYERAGQILTRISVATARNFIRGVPCPVPRIGQPVTVVAPARVDMAGSWTDTPPLSFELGGSVTTIAITVNGEVVTYVYKHGSLCGIYMYGEVLY